MKSAYIKISFFCSICFALLVPSFAIGQVIFYQNFDGTYTTVSGATSLSIAGSSCIPAAQTWTGSAAGGSGTSYYWYRDDQTPAFSGGFDLCGVDQPPTCTEAGAYSLFFDGFDAPNNATATIISPSINLTTYTGGCKTVLLQFYYFNTDETSVQVAFSNNGGTSFGLTETALTTQSSGWQIVSYLIPAAYCTANFEMEFTATSAFGIYPIALDEITLTASTGPSGEITSETQAGCFQSNGSVTLEGLGDTGPYTYAWSNGETSSTATGLAAGTYTCTITDATLPTHCTSAVTVAVTNPTITAVISSSTGTCNACSTGTATVSASGGSGTYTYSWSPTGYTGGTTATYSALPAGTYTCTVTDANGCTASVSVQIGQLFTANGTFTVPACVTSINVDMAGGIGGGGWNFGVDNYSLGYPARVQATIAVTPGQILNIYVGQTGGNPTSTTTGGAAGAGGNADENGGTGYGSANTNDNSHGVGSGGGGGGASCIRLSTTTAFADDILSAGGGGGEGEDYFGGVNGGNGGGTGSPATNGSDNNSNSEDGIAGGAASAGTAVSWGCAAKIASTAGGAANGDGGNGGMTDKAGGSCSTYGGGGGGGGGHFAGSGGCGGGGGGGWSYTGGFGANTVTGVTVTAGYTVSASYVTIAYTASGPTITLTSQTNMTCTPNTGAAIVSASGGTAPYVYAWAPSAGVTGAATASASTMAAGTYTCTVTDHNGTGCSSTLVVTITGPTTTLSATSTHTNIPCFGQTTGTATANPANGTPSYTYSWNSAPVQTTALATGLAAGSYTCTVKDANGCSTTTSVTITQPVAALSITPTQSNATAGGCFKNGSATSTVAGGTTAYTYVWAPVGYTGAGTATYSTLIAGTYTCTVTDANGCTTSNTFTITGGANVTASITSSTNPTTCAGNNGSAVAAGAGGTGPYTYSWLPSTGVTGAATSSPTTMAAGTYTCTVTDHNGCTATTIVTLSAPSGTNDNFGCATPISIQSTCTPTFLSGTNNAASLETHEEIDCQGFGGGSGGYPSIRTTVWYSFTVSAATGSGPFFIDLNDQTGKTSGGKREYYHGLSIWNTTALPATTCATCPCAPVQCMDNSDVGYSNYLAQNDCRNNNDVQQVQPAFTEYSVALNNLPNGTYYIQVGYPETGDADAFQIAVSTCLPTGYILTNPLPATGQGQVSAAGTCYSIAAGEPVSAASECPVAIPYVLLTGNNCSSRGNISNCTACPSGNNNTSSSCIPCFGALATGINFSSNSVTYPAGYYPSPSSDIGSSTTTYQQVGTSEGLGTLQGGVIGSGYVTQYCYSFSTNSTSTEINANLQSYAEYLLYGGGSASGASNCTYLGSGGSASTVYWADWALYSANMGSLYGCGNINSFSVTGLGCNTTYVLCMSAQTGYGLYIAHDNTQAYSVYPWVGQNMCNPTSNLCTTVLPITLSSFQVEYEQATNSVTIYWSTASQINNKLFTVEKSVDGTNWQTVTTMDGAGTTSEAMYYNATDESPFAGISYYRLKQTDYDGTSLYSNIAPVNIPSSYSVDIFPNPTTGNMTLRYGTESPDPVSIKITDISGITVSSYTIDNVQKGMNDFTVNTSALTAGMYIIQITNPQKTFYQKFVKQ